VFSTPTLGPDIPESTYGSKGDKRFGGGMKPDSIWLLDFRFSSKDWVLDLNSNYSSFTPL
jgi:hypothetical protein